MPNISVYEVSKIKIKRHHAEGMSCRHDAFEVVELHAFVVPEQLHDTVILVPKALHHLKDHFSLCDNKSKQTKPDTHEQNKENTVVKKKRVRSDQFSSAIAVEIDQI